MKTSLVCLILVPMLGWSYYGLAYDPDTSKSEGRFEYQFENGRKILYLVEDAMAVWDDTKDEVIPAAPRLMPATSLGRFHANWNDTGEPHWHRFAVIEEVPRPLVHIENAYQEIFAVFQSGEYFKVPVSGEFLTILFWPRYTNYTEIHDWESYDFRFENHDYALLMIGGAKGPRYTDAGDQPITKVYLNRDDGWAIELASLDVWIQNLKVGYASGKLHFIDEKKNSMTSYAVPDITKGYNMRPKPLSSKLYEAIKAPIDYSLPEDVCNQIMGGKGRSGQDLGRE